MVHYLLSLYDFLIIYHNNLGSRLQLKIMNFSINIDKIYLIYIMYYILLY